MPHATDEDAMMAMTDDERAQKWMTENGLLMGGGDLDSRPLDVGDKADDAEDFEDISDDDDLPEEEEATNNFAPDSNDRGFYEQLTAGTKDLPELPQTNGQHQDNDAIDGLFGEQEDDHNDLFNDLPSPVEPFRPEPLTRTTSSLALPNGRSNSLALPSGVSLYPSQSPVAHHSQQSPLSMSPPVFNDVPQSPDFASEDEDDPNLSFAERQQLALFKESKARRLGLDVPRTSIENDSDLFWTLFPAYDQKDLPYFTQLWRPRPGIYKGKAPLKPPKPVQPTKLTLDILMDQERNFKTMTGSKGGVEPRPGIEYIRDTVAYESSDDDIALSDIDEDEQVGGLSTHDLSMICENWDVASMRSDSTAEPVVRKGHEPDDEWDLEDARPAKRRKLGATDSGISFAAQFPFYSFEDPERTTGKLSKTVALDMNDPYLLIDEHAPQIRKSKKRIQGDLRLDATISRDLAKRYNISNDLAYDALKENHQHKVRSTLGSLTAEHAVPALKLQYPFYKVRLDGKEMRNFHRRHLELHDRPGKEYKFSQSKYVKKKHTRGREVKELFAKAKDLSIGDTSNVLLLEYSEEVPIMLSNFGMGSRLINYYRKRNPDDSERPKREIGETHVLLTQDKSPFSVFGHVDGGEIVPTFQNSLYRAPIFQHPSKPTDFIVSISSTYEDGSQFFLRNVDNLYTVGQQFPLAEVPGEHSRKVTDAAKKRLRAIAYRILHKVIAGHKNYKLDNQTMISHVAGSDVQQIRTKMREFMHYTKESSWDLPPGKLLPELDALRTWLRPEDICLLDSMQVGVQHLVDLGLGGDKEGFDDKELDDNANIELQLAPWQTTKNFLNACQGKAMLKLHGEGDPTGRGEAFNFVKTSMKGGFKALGESVADKIEAKRRKENGGHQYNVAQQQKAYDDHIRKIWTSQKQSLGNEVENSDAEMEDDDNEQPESAYADNFARGATPRSSIGTPAALGRNEDDSVSMYSRRSGAAGGGQVMVVTRQTKNAYGQSEVQIIPIQNAKVIELYRKRRTEKKVEYHKERETDPKDIVDPDVRNGLIRHYEKTLSRLERNKARTAARDKAKGRVSTGGVGAAGSPPAGSPGPSDADGPASALNGGTDNTPAKGKGKNKDAGTARKCANCGQVGHIKTNRKSVYTCSLCKSKTPYAVAAISAAASGGSGDFNTSADNTAASLPNNLPLPHPSAKGKGKQHERKGAGYGHRGAASLHTAERGANEASDGGGGDRRQPSMLDDYSEFKL